MDDRDEDGDGDGDDADDCDNGVLVDGYFGVEEPEDEIEGRSVDRIEF